MIAVCVGHARRGDSGAVACDGETTERVYNTDLADRIAIKLDAHGIPCQVFNEYEAADYPRAMKWLAGQLQKAGALVAVELHFNSSHVRSASGHEWLYWHGSEMGRAVARSLDVTFRNHFPRSLARGVKVITAKDNGACFLRMTPCPAVICEPFFGSNQDEWETVAGRPETLAAAIAAGLAGCYNLFEKGWK